MADKRETQPPLLFISDVYWTEEKKHIIYSVTENRFRLLNDPVLVGKQIQGSSYGWLVLVDCHRNTEEGYGCCLFNPISKEIIALPYQKPQHCLSDRCILSKPPTEPDCHILFVDNLEQCFCKVGDHEFVRVLSHKAGRALKSIVSFQGKIYGLLANRANGDHKLVTIHFVDKKIKFRPVLGTRPWRIPQLSPPWSPGQHCNLMWLVEAPVLQGDGGDGTELLLVQKTYSCRQFEHGVEFRVFGIDMNEMKIEELQSIGERTIFISHYGNVFCGRSSVGGLKPNSIYYTYQYGRNLHVFDLEDRSATSMLPSRDVTVESSITSWVEHSSCHKLLAYSS